MTKPAFQLRRWQFIRWFDSLPILVVRYLFLALSAVAVTVIVLDLFIPLSSVIVALSVLFLAPAILAASFTSYVHFLKSHPNYRIDKSLKRADPFNNFDFQALDAVVKLKQPNGWKAFWRSVLRDNLANEFLMRLGLVDQHLMEISANVPVDADNIIAASIQQAEGEQATIFTVLEIVLALPEYQEYLEGENIQVEDLAELLSYYRGQRELEKLPKHQSRTGGFARTWAVSYTNLLDDVAPSLSENVINRAAMVPIYSRSKLVDQIIVQLNTGHNHNVVLTGGEGVGKTELFYHLAAKIYQSKTKTALDELDIRSLDISRLLVLATDPAELQQVITAVFNEIIRAGNVVLFIDHLELLLAPDASIGTADIASALQAVLANPRVRIIATTSNQAYLELIKPNSLLSEAFYRVEVPEPNPNELFGMVLSQLNRIEYHYHVFFMATAVRELVTLGRKYLKDQLSPERELNLAETVAATGHSQGKVIISADDVALAVEQKAKVPILVKDEENQTLLNLEANLHRRVIGQNAAIKQVSDALLRARAGLSQDAKPIGTFLFLGPTGVGKTETAKALAEIYFGSTNRLIRLDMTEYADATGLQKLLGTDAKRDPGALAMAVQQNPSAVVLFDEIEKAGQQVKNALLPLLDEGRLTTNYGLVLDFTNTIVIATSNAGSDFIRSQIQNGVAVASFERQLVDQLIASGTFLTEFLNRFAGVIVFTPLSQVEIQAVVALQINALKNRLFQEKGITIDFAPAVISALAQKGYDPVFGARALQRVMANDLETVIARKIISESPKAGTKIQIDSL